MNEIKEGFNRISGQTVFMTMLLVIVNYLILGSYDFISTRIIGEKTLKYPRILLSAFICYAVTLNIGAFVGGMGFRYRIYSGWKIPKKKIPLIILFSTLSNWVGYTLLAGILFLTQFENIQKLLGLPQWLTTVLGIVSLSIVITYFILCKNQYETKVKNIHFAFPSLSVAFLQLALSCIQWSILSLIIYVFLNGLGADAGFGQVMFAFLVSSIAGVLTHIPSGIGVLESIFLRMDPEVADSTILVALICYRVIYYLIPLMLAIPAYFYVEFYQKKKFT